MPPIHLSFIRCLTLAWLAFALPATAQELTVSGAASLTNAFKDIGSAFEATHTGVKITFNFAASDVLVTQIAEGAPVDVLATADQESMNKAEAQNLLDKASRKNFASNTLVLIVPSDAKTAPATLADLRQDAFKRIAIGNPESVPVGRYAKQALEAANLWTALGAKLINTQNVRQALDYVSRGEAEAGFVYATDAMTMHGQVKVVLDVPSRKRIVYPIAAIGASKHKALAEQFVAFVTSEPGQAILAKFGFAKP